MIYTNLEVGLTATSTPIGIQVENETNKNIYVNNDIFYIKETGVYEICGTATVESTGTGNYGSAIYSESKQIANNFINEATASGELSTIPIYAVVEIIKSQSNGYAELSILPVGTPTIVSGTISIKRIV